MLVGDRKQQTGAWTQAGPWAAERLWLSQVGSQDLVYTVSILWG